MSTSEDLRDEVSIAAAPNAVDSTLCTERAASAPDPGAIAKLVGKDTAFLLEAAQAAAEVRSRAQAVRDTIVALLTELTRS